ncbi:hypothetical protein ACJZ2D_015127 [Fusarium nematophilum]
MPTPDELARIVSLVRAYSCNSATARPHPRYAEDGYDDKVVDFCHFLDKDPENTIGTSAKNIARTRLRYRTAIGTIDQTRATRPSSSGPSL